MTISLEEQIGEDKVSFYETKVNDTYKELGVKQEHQDSFGWYLNILKSKDLETYLHSLRVGLKAKEVADFIKTIEPKAMFLSGISHDFGKILTNPISLKKKEGFGEKDMEELRKHVIDGYKILRGVHDFSANVLLYHHYFQEKGYPKKIPKGLTQFSNGTQLLIMEAGRLLSLVDFYDAAKHRENNKYSEDKNKVEKIGGLEVKEKLLKHNPDKRHLIYNLYWKKIFE